MKKRWRSIGLVMVFFAVIFLAITSIGYIKYAEYAPMYDTASNSLEKMLRLTGTAWDNCLLQNAVEVVAKGTEPGQYKQGLSEEVLYIQGQTDKKIKMDIIDGTIVIDPEGELTVFIIGDRAVYPYDENTAASLSVEGFTTIPENLSEYGVTINLKDGKEAKAVGGSRAKPYAMKLKEKDFDVTAPADLKVNLIIIDGCLTLEKPEETTVTILGENQRYAYDGTEKSASDYQVKAADGITAGVVKAATQFEIFCMKVRILFLALGLILLIAGLLYTFFPDSVIVHYILKRLGQSFLTIVLIVSIVFFLMRLMPTDYYFTEQELIKLTDQQKHDKLMAAGLLDPVLVQLARFWYNGLLRFDFGTSHRIQSGIDVVTVIGSKLGVSMRLGLISLGIALVVGVVLGVLQARFKDGIIDKCGTAYTIFVNAVPHLVSYTLILAIGTRVFGAAARYTSADPAGSSVLPIICLATGSIASYMLWMRRYMVDELNKDYIRLAKLKGLSTTKVMFRHVMKNAFLPLAQYLPYNILLTIGGSLLVERFFSVPGLGPLLTDAIARYDCNIVQAIVMFYAILGILGLFLGDLLMTLIDPRISLTGKGETR